jgi:cytochrome c-type biogenesis protein CcmH
LRAPPESQDIAAAVARIEAHLAAVPKDGRGYEILAPVYMRMKRYDDAARAYLHAMDLLGETAERRMLYGEALVYAAGMVTPDARAAFEAALKLDAKAVMPQFYLAIAAEQDGDLALARTLLSRIVADAPADAPWLETTREHLLLIDQEMARGSAAGASPPKSPPIGKAQEGAGQSQAEAAIAALPPDAQKATIERMVDSLATRLNADGRDAEGWVRLIRAYYVLNRPELARDAWTRAHQQVGQDPVASEKLDALARELGLGG